MSMKNSSDTIGNRTRDLLACSAVPEPTAPPRASWYLVYIIMFLLEIMLLTTSLWKINIVDCKKIPPSSYKHLAWKMRVQCNAFVHYVRFRCFDRDNLDGTLRRIFTLKELSHKEHKGQGLWTSLKLLHGDLKQVCFSNHFVRVYTL